MNAVDLLTLADLKSWLQIALQSSGSDDRNLATLITAMSSDVLRETGLASFAAANYTETRDGTGTDTILPRNFPINSVSSVTIDTIPLQQSSNGILPGYTFDQYKISIVGQPPWLLGGGISPTQYNNSNAWLFRQGRQNVILGYNAGAPLVAIVGELQTIPATPGPYSIVPENAYSNFTDQGVKYFSSGIPLMAVFVAPTATGTYYYNTQYGMYQFAASDQGVQVVLAYTAGGVPFELSQVLKEWAAERYLMRKNIGIRSTTSKAGESTSFREHVIPQYVQNVISRYKRMPG
jgi:hypothetical protein